MLTRTGCLKTLHKTARTSENRTRNVLVLVWMLPLEYVQICVYYNRHSDTRNLYSWQCECTLTLGGLEHQRNWFLFAAYGNSRNCSLTFFVNKRIGKNLKNVKKVFLLENKQTFLHLCPPLCVFQCVVCMQQVCNCVSSVAGTEWFIKLHPHTSSSSSPLVAELCNSWLLSSDTSLRCVACHIVSNVIRNVPVS